MKTKWIASSALALIATAALAYASEGSSKPLKHVDWAYNGVFGNVDKQSAQRGFQVYKEVCSACHSLKRIAFRNLTDIGFTEAEVKALASTYQVQDGPNDAGEMFERPGKASDYFPLLHPNDEATRAANNGALPPDLSLIIKARPDGGNYVYSLLTGYGEPPADVHMSEGMHYNAYFPGHQIAMAAPLSEGQVTFSDGTASSVDQMSHDVVTFLQWAAEPEMEARKSMGLKVIIYLAIFTAFMFIAKRNLWRKLH